MQKQATTPTTIPQHVFERLEYEWRQMQTSREPAPKPAPRPSQG
jgi:hypothetical protein